MRALFDINVLIALLDAEHLHHEAARAWLRRNIEHGWATSPITQNGCLRVMAQPAYPDPMVGGSVGPGWSGVLLSDAVTAHARRAGTAPRWRWLGLRLTFMYQKVRDIVFLCA